MNIYLKYIYNLPYKTAIYYKKHTKINKHKICFKWLTNGGGKSMFKKKRVINNIICVKNQSEQI